MYNICYRKRFYLVERNSGGSLSNPLERSCEHKLMGLVTKLTRVSETV